MTPMRRGLDLFVILSLLLMPFAFAAHTAVVSADSVSVYETNSANLTLDIENDFASTSTINLVDVLTAGFSINEIIALIDWSVENNNSIKFSTSTAGISNWGSQKFGFGISAGNVDQDTTYDWTITTTDTNAESQANIIQLTILNDATPPEITATTPGPFNLGANELFSITANDPETGISGSELKVSNCDEIYNNETNTSAVEYETITLLCENGVCSSTQDLSSWDEGDVCFNFNVHNNGGETSNSGDLISIIDRTAPIVTLISPETDAFFDVTMVQLSFNAVDNYDTELECEVSIDGITNAMTANGDASYDAVFTDGIHTWSVSCTDEVDLVGTSEERTLTVDTLAPNITLTAPSIVDRGTNAVITVEITDAGVGVDTNSISAQLIDTLGNITDVEIVDGTITIPTTVETLPGIYTIIIDAADNLGHEAENAVQFRVRETFTITASINPNQIDASTENNTLYSTLTGTIAKDDGSIPTGMVSAVLIMSTEDLEINNETGAFTTQVQIPTENGAYIITATYVNGEDSFNATASIAVGPYCGNNVVDETEECDGSTDAVCSDYGFSLGTTSCTNTCTIDTSQCSNPPPSPGGGGGGGRRHSSVNVPFVTPAEPAIVDRPTTGGIIETPPVEETPKETEKNLASGDLITGSAVVEENTFGLGAAWAAVTDYVGGLNQTLLAALLILALLLYFFGWKKDKDEWDGYFNRYGHK
ncbi:hypothetical protein JXB27_02000 [Candidatus Woesearchaeota archaeon]|nr:hypothetical protein [Candidatus Woesearchaeota archaeon]